MDASTRVAYLAGIVDGEGTILLKRGAPRADGVRVVHHVYVRVMNTSRPLCEWLQSEFAGCLRLSKPARGTRRAMWEWAVAGREASDVLKQIEPLLIIKREQAQVALAVARSMTANGKRLRLSDDQVVWRDEQRALLVALRSA